MIRKLISLSVSGFRTFADPIDVPLDSDVVLIYGPNGTGKTSLLCGIELAVSGTVGHLAKFSEDYPRCLRRVGAQGISSASLTFETVESKRATQGVTIDDELTLRAELNVLPQRYRQHFIERCYLSQSRLSRLLEIYQAVSVDEPEQPLVRYVRELLGLDPLENLTSGLHSAGDIRRTVKLSEGLRVLNASEQANQQNLAALVNEEVEASTALEEWHRRALPLHDSVGDPLASEQWDASSINARYQKLHEFTTAEVRKNRLQELERLRGKLEGAQQMLASVSASEAPSDDPGTLRRRSELAALLKNLESQLLEAAQRAETTIASAMRFDGPTALAVEDRLAAIDVRVRRFAAQCAQERSVLQSSNADVKAAEERLVRIDVELKDLSREDAQIAARSRRLVTFLRGAIEHIDGDDCPICRRDFGEVGRGHLRDDVLKHLQELGAGLTDAEANAQKLADLNAERSEALRRIEASQKVLQAQASAVAVLATAEPLVAQVAELLLDIKATRERRSEVSKELEAIDNHRRRFERLRSQRSEGSRVVLGIAQELRVDTPEALTEEQLTEATSRALQSGLARAQQAAYERTQLLEVYQEAMRCAQRLDAIRADLVRLRAEASAIAGARARVSQAISVAKGVSRAATEAKRQVLDRVFNERLNGLCVDLFRRLTVGEHFSPRLSEPASHRGQVRASVQAVLHGASPFEQLASVLSAGNVNTAALSLFLSLHLIEEPAHHVLLLDDPVQSMDDVHVVQMASLLRALAHQARRQLVLAVHERALFDYLSSELGPTADGQTLTTVELHRDPRTFATTLDVKRREWEGSPDRFGRAASSVP